MVKFTKFNVAGAVRGRDRRLAAARGAGREVGKFVRDAGAAPQSNSKVKTFKRYRDPAIFAMPDVGEPLSCKAVLHDSSFRGCVGCFNTPYTLVDVTVCNFLKMCLVGMKLDISVTSATAQESLRNVLEIVNRVSVCTLYAGEHSRRSLSS
ncbi:hypothetical protein EVAR_10611_1 [Eumeta japonica]|uniref:Uncharacterized protein n=1 Tax=Eumeta variegata TaxID=151549 RepID=A0A4C1U3D9_EUMVA|nr:hypothetical protein EVAR_10611_1 [Eumeta japonica]